MATVSAKKKILFSVLCLASVTQGMYSTYFVSILTTIERIYQIKSKTAGAILSATEIGQIIGSPVIAYFGGRGNKPKWIAACMTLTALAALAATTPHFMLTSRLFIFFTSLLVIGFGSTAVTTLGIPFIDDIVSKEESPLYLGLSIGLRIFGPALGFLLGSLCIGISSSAIFGGQSSDPAKAQKLNETQLQPEHISATHSEVDNAWWLGLVIISVPLICLALPMYYLSARLSTRSSCSHDTSSIDLSSTVTRLVKNKLLLLRMLSGVLHILPIAGFYTFLPKYLIEQYQLTSSSASAISGLAGILFVGLGTFFGGTVVRVWNVNSKTMTKWIATSSLFYAIGMLILMNLGCKQAHQTVYYHSNIEQLSLETPTTTGCETDILSQCLSRCKCSSNVYNPVCANGTTFMSPCLAGCKSYVLIHDKVIYEDCGGCDYMSSNSSTLTLDSNVHQQPPSEHVNLNVAMSGHCPLICDNLKWYIIAFSIFTLIHASSEAGSMMFNLRCVDQNDRTLALGLITLTSSLFG